MALETLRDLFLNELRDMYHAEKQLVRALPRMAKAADSDELRQAIEKHLGETQNQVKRLENVFQSLDEPARGKRCQGMEGIIEEGKEILEEDGQEPVIDAAIIAAAQKVEHYEIASYGCLITYADLLGERDASRLLKQNLSEEEATDKALSQLAERSINQAAAAVGGDTEEEEE
jgi:ferritin-like metal-binding protein YciE